MPIVWYASLGAKVIIIIICALFTYQHSTFDGGREWLGLVRATSSIWTCRSQR